MSLLEELERQAAAARGRDAIAAAASEAQTAMAKARARPALERIRGYLERAAKALNALEPPISCSYSIAGVGELSGLVQGAYQCVPEPGAPQVFRFRFECRRPQALKAVLASEAQARDTERRLIDAGLGCRRVAHSGQRRGLLVEPRVPVTLRFQRREQSIELLARNLTGIGTSRYPIDPEAVSAELLQALLEAVMRRPERFSALTGNTVADADRHRLRRQLAREKRRREAELGGVLTRLAYLVSEAVRRLVLRQ